MSLNLSRRLCPECEYDLHSQWQQVADKPAVTTVTCPECGKISSYNECLGRKKTPLVFRILVGSISLMLFAFSLMISYALAFFGFVRYAGWRWGSGYGAAGSLEDAFISISYLLGFSCLGSVFLFLGMPLNSTKAIKAIMGWAAGLLYFLVLCYAMNLSLDDTVYPRKDHDLIFMLFLLITSYLLGLFLGGCCGLNIKKHLRNGGQSWLARS